MKDEDLTISVRAPYFNEKVLEVGDGVRFTLRNDGSFSIKRDDDYHTLFSPGVANVLRQNLGLTWEGRE